MLGRSGVYYCVRGVFWFSILGCTIIIINSCCASDAGYSPESSGRRRRRQWGQRRPQKRNLRLGTRGDGALLCSREIERESAGKLLQCACEAAEGECVRDELLRYFHNILYDNNNNTGIRTPPQRRRLDYTKLRDFPRYRYYYYFCYIAAIARDSVVF